MRLGAAQFVRSAAFLAGLGVAAIAVAGWRVPTQSIPGASLKVVAVGTNELVASPARPFLVTSNLKPGRSQKVAGGQVSLTNTMTQPLAVRIRALSSVPDLNHVLRVRATATGEPLFRGTLGGLRSWTKRAFVVPSHRRAALEMQAWVPASVKGGYQNRAAKLTVEFKLAPAEKARLAPVSGGS
jgi:hypothetical protein